MLTRNAPWSLLHRDFDHLFREMDRFVPRIDHPSVDCDIHETESGYLFSMELPGVDKDDINIESTANSITVSSERKRDNTVKDATAHKLERSYGTVKRTFALPEGVEPAKIEANYENGILYLSIPKAETALPKRITVNSGKAGFLKELTERKKISTG